MTDPTRKEWPEGRKMAAEIIRRHPEVFKDVPPLSDVLFVIDTDAEPKSKGNYVNARVSKITGKFVDFIDAGGKTFMLEWFQSNVGNMTRNQRYLLMAHELLHFDRNEESGDYTLRGHDVEEFFLIADKFGLRWNQPTRGDVADILAPDFEWGKVGQKQLDLVGLAAEMVDQFGIDGARQIVAAAQEIKGQGDAAVADPQAFAQQVQDHVAGLGAKVLPFPVKTGTGSD